MKADYNKVKNFLSEKHFVPQEFGKGETRIQIVGCDMSKVQILGPYKEVSIQVPIVPMIENHNPKYAHLYLPVTTESARWPGVDIAGFPKFIANIDIINQSGILRCRLSEGDENILEFSTDDALGTQKRFKWEYYGIRKFKVINTVFKLEGDVYEGYASSNTKLTFGNHPIANNLQELLISNEVIRVEIGHNLSGYLRKPVIIHG